MHWSGWIPTLLALIVGGWMLIDGVRAMVVGDYFTPAQGDYAGQLGPWARIVSSFGIDPRGSLMMGIFILFGLAMIASAIGLILNQGWAWWSMLVLSIGVLWYAPFGSIAGLTSIVVLLLAPLR